MYFRFYCIYFVSKMTTFSNLGISFLLDRNLLFSILLRLQKIMLQKEYFFKIKKVTSPKILADP